MRATRRISQPTWDAGGDFACDECESVIDISGYRANDGGIYVLCDECATDVDAPRVGRAD